MITLSRRRFVALTAAAVSAASLPSARPSPRSVLPPLIPCDGRQFSRFEYPELFNIMGSDVVPDMRGAWAPPFQYVVVASEHCDDLDLRGFLGMMMVVEVRD